MVSLEYQMIEGVSKMPQGLDMEIRRVDGWQVRSESDPKTTYIVSTLGDGAWRCDCPDYMYRGMVRYCKHIEAVRLLPENRPRPPKTIDMVDRMYGRGTSESLRGR